DTIWDFAVDPKDWHIAYAVSSTRVYKTTDAWLHYNSVNLTGPPRSDSYRNLKSLSLTDLRTVELIQLPGQKAGQGVLLVGGQGGVYKKDLQTDTAWTEFGAGLPNDVVIDLDYDPQNHLLLAATYGRGVWTISGVESYLTMTPTLNIVATDGDDTIDLIRNSGNPLLLDVTVNEGGGPREEHQSVPLSILKNITVSASGV